MKIKTVRMFGCFCALDHELSVKILLEITIWGITSQFEIIDWLLQYTLSNKVIMTDVNYDVIL